MLKPLSAQSPQDRKTLQVYGLEEDAVEVEGYAFAGSGQKIGRVDVNADDGKTWHQAEFSQTKRKDTKAEHGSAGDGSRLDDWQVGCLWSRLLTRVTTLSRIPASRTTFPEET